jgi:hypothetical protein
VTDPTPAPAVCGTAHYDHPETVCTEPPRHRLPHSGPLIIDGLHCGGAAWDDPDTTPEPLISDPTPHACGNCEGIDPASCLANPDRPKAVPAPVDPALTDRVAAAARTILDGAGPRTTSEWATLVARAILAELAPELGRAEQAASAGFVTVERPDGTTWTDLKRLADGRVMCCLCFGYTPRSGLTDDPEHPGCVTDVCKSCAAAEVAQAAVRRAEQAEAALTRVRAAAARDLPLARFEHRDDPSGEERGWAAAMAAVEDALNPAPTEGSPR